MATATAVDSHARLERALALLVGGNTPSAELSLKSHRKTLVFYRRDAAECARRRHHDAAPLAIGHLATLLELPTELDVPLAALPKPLRERTHALPRAAATLTGSRIRRHAVRPLAVDLALLRTSAHHWKKALIHACDIAPFARCALLLNAPTPADERDDLYMRAAYYGIGVLEPASDGLVWAVPPESHPDFRHTPVDWQFTEQLHARLP
ncbi:hypothetical protein [Streptomyces reniochalinae]|uniref:Uncharacterized protein n=1 Tax=Streptomyces reniochalinae TaxID=2250578 RepID=A0A367E6C5_9ACTN|nr:hypothetical protein [Streptomyces reniochalinae]RCG13255.1 hypothetical protein DQ392_33655 [Streptomyces reniochalinae]